MTKTLVRRLKNVIHSKKSWKIGVPIFLVIATVAFGVLSGNGKVPSSTVAWNSIGFLVGETTFNDPPEYVSHDSIIFYYIARIMGLLLIPYAFILLIYELYKDVFTQIRIGMWRLRRRPYVVVCGIGWKGYELVKNILDDDALSLRVIGIDSLQSKESQGQIEELQGKGMAFFEGNAAAGGLLHRAKAIKAKKIYIMTGSDEMNCRIAMKLSDLAKEQKKRMRSDINCYVSVENQRQRDFLEDFAGKQTNRLCIHCFNLFEQAARGVIRKKGLISSPQQNVHCVIIGNTPVAKAVLLQCLRMLHLYKHQERKITVICENHERYRDRFFLEYPCLLPNLSPEMEKARLGVFPEIHFEEMPSSGSGWMTNDFVLYDGLKEGWRTNVYMCVDDGIKSLALMELIHPRLNQFAGEVNATCYYNYPETGLDRDETAWYEFGDYNDVCSIDAIHDAAENELAKDVLVVWGSNRKDWLKETSWSKESSRQSADHIYMKLVLAGLNTAASQEEISNIFGHKIERNDPDSGGKYDVYEGQMLDELAEIEHRRWCAERLLLGWLPLDDAEHDRAKWNLGVKEYTEKEQKDMSKSDRTAWEDAKKYCRSLKKIYRYHGDLIPYKELEPCEKTKDHKIIGSVWKMYPHIIVKQEELIEKIAAHIHARWMELRIDEGWTHGDKRDDKNKKHPNLVPYKQLGEEEKKYDRATAKTVMDALKAKKYGIKKTECSHTSSFDSATVIEDIAKQVHEQWARGRKQQGWKYGPVRDDATKKTPCLVPYDELPESEKEYDRAAVRETLQVLKELGYEIVEG